ncbi:hypothetical protein CPB84DRAFT_1760427 [Gymnopilus junonius]|uniref:Guanine nucleotide-binding protein-like 1 n=1 Tax=Gymnopilus junonius TaxID=109634 RepID=A0A9P5TUH1_GYMJU|nr:hypothetical protein CPB84DRAFT_1760427 [Gymnopilus junonius]
MPPRRKPTSTRQKKADQQSKRAIRRGDVPTSDVVKKTTHRRPRVGPTGQQVGASSTIESARKLQSAFIKLPPDFLEQTKNLASTLPLLRLIPDEKAISPKFLQDGETDPLSCPRRPKWRYDMSKLEVERNEEGLFRKYIAQTDQALEKWQNMAHHNDAGSGMPRSPSYFERNLEVWRQFWRVAEISQIILLLLDSRCPILHYPPSLSNYLADQKVILVLTKVDISGPVRVQHWLDYIKRRHPGSRVVQVESYAEKEGQVDHTGRKQYEPCIPLQFRAALIDAIKDAHSELLEPPQRVASKPDRLKDWIPSVKKHIDWDGLLRAKGSKVGIAVGGAAVPLPKSPEGDGQNGNSPIQEPSHLTIGLIGQPNVGKSSLLNALFGTQKVRASKTPGKTKHFQTLFWTDDVRLVDCPGLVMPNYVPMEMQVLSGILPISRVSAVPACIHFAAQLLPLERIYNLIHPSTTLPPVEDKRTWRDNRKPEENIKNSEQTNWTAMDILTAYADAKGWVTAKAGRPDIHRAGNAILRSLAEGRIKWAFWPPDMSAEQISAENGGIQGNGIWVPQSSPVDDESEPESLPESDAEENVQRTDTTEEVVESSEDEGNATGIVDGGRFGALAINDDENDEHSQSASSDSEEF